MGRKREKTLWTSGIEEWDDFLEAGSIKGISKRRKSVLDEQLEQATTFLDARQTHYFSKCLPSNEHWRLFGEFKNDTAYLDIETDARPPYPSITVVGIHRNGRTTTLVRGEDLDAEAVKDALDGCKLLVTFNGASYDLPIIQYHFPFALPRVPHFDLRHTCRRVGMTGGLKKIERGMGMRRAREVEYITGEDAVYLWRVWERKQSANALKMLKRYNTEDTENLRPIAEYVYDTLRSNLLKDIEM